MPDESCRTCGGPLVRLSQCSQCRKTMQKKCDICDSVTHAQIHIECKKHDSQSQESAPIQFQNFRITNA